MSERFYFDIEHGEETIRDEEGAEAASLEEAMNEARSVIQEIAEELGRDNLSDTCKLIVRNAEGSLVGRLLFRQ